MQITVVGSADLPQLLPLMRAYCDFYQVAPGDQALLELSQALPADPQREGLLARDDTGKAVGFATLFWTWQTLAAARVRVMNDRYVAAEARGTGVADELIAACLERCRDRGATQLVSQTAVDNHHAPRLAPPRPPERPAGAVLQPSGRCSLALLCGHDDGIRPGMTTPRTRLLRPARCAPHAEDGPWAGVRTASTPPPRRRRR